MYRVNLSGYEYAWTNVPCWDVDGDVWEIDDILSEYLPLWIKGYEGDNWSIRTDIPEIWNVYDLDYEESKKVRPFTASDYRPLRKIISVEQESLFNGKTQCDCKADLIIRLGESGYTTLHCLNPYCFYKTGYSFAILLKNFGIEGVGDITCLNVARELYFKNLYASHEAKVRYKEMLDPDSLWCYTDNARKEIANTFEKIKEYTGSLSELVKMSGLPYIGENASKYFTKTLLGKKYLYKEDLSDILKFSSTKLSVEENMWCYIEDIKALYRMSNARDLSNATTIEIAITGSLRNFKSKDKFLETINTLSNPNNLVFVKKDTVNLSTQILIADSNSNSSKFRRAKELNIPIMTSQEFVIKFRKLLNIEGVIL